MKKKITLNHLKLIYRLVLFFILLYYYCISKITDDGYIFNGLEKNIYFLIIVWFIFFLEMLIKIIPNKKGYTGEIKHFKKNYVKIEKPFKKESFKKTFLCVFAWCFPNFIFILLYLIGIFDKGIMILLSSIYSVCDIICLLYFCPFKDWILKNKCCNTCRIYNWDSIFMFTPFIVIKSIFTWSLLAMAIIVLIQWEYAYIKHPERFYELTNEALKCKNCKNKICKNKKCNW